MSFFKRKKDTKPQFYSLKKIYKGKLLPLKETNDFHEFVSSQLNEPDFDAKPMILLVDFPGIRIGPEPTKDFLHHCNVWRK